MPAILTHHGQHIPYMKSVFTFGEALIDLHAFPLKGQASLQAFAPYPGGAPANVAVAVAKLGGPSAFLGVLGNDLFGELLFSSLSDAGVNTSYILRTNQATTALAFISHDATGERQFTFYGSPTAGLTIAIPLFNKSSLASAAVLHTCSNTLSDVGLSETTLSWMLRAREQGVVVSFDMNLRPALWPREEDPTPRLWKALAVADIIKLSAEELTFLSGPLGGSQPVLAKLWQHCPRLLLVTDGPRPLRWFTPAQQGKLSSFAVKTKDTTGAGDAFMGGLLYQLASHDNVRTALTALIADTEQLNDLLRFASACGALSTTSIGSFSAMPGLPAIRAFLASPDG